MSSLTHHRLRASGLIVCDRAILLAAYRDGRGRHYNIPGGGVEPGESLEEAVLREVWEEAGVRVDVGELVFTYEYVPGRAQRRFEGGPVLSLFFHCRLTGDAAAAPTQPDDNQTGAEWIALNRLESVVLYPRIQKHILSWVETGSRISLITEQSLQPYSR